MAEPTLERRAQMFPRLTPAQIDRIAAHGVRRAARAGELLFEPGDRHTAFFVVISGAVDVVRPVDGREEPFVTHGPGNFTGEVNVLSSLGALVRGRMARDVESDPCEGEEIAIVGGGNSAGRAAVFLAQIASRVHVLVRGKRLAESMSRYLIERIDGTPNIVLRTGTRIEALEGSEWIERIRCRQAEAAGPETYPIRHVFMMTGADAKTSWHAGCVALDDKGFVKTGADLGADELARARWALPRPPSLLETSIPGVFAVGDVRAGSVKRVASAVGEGSICVPFVHRALQEL